MPSVFLSGRLLAVTTTNFCLFLIITAWSFLPLFIVDLGGNKLDVGIVIGSLGITSLGSLPFLAPLLDRYGRKIFITGGVLVAGLSNAAFPLFHEYSALLIPIRLIQGLAFAACFNGCATAVVDLVPKDKRAQGIGLFGISGSLATAVGPYLAEVFILRWGFTAYFALLIGFGTAGFLVALTVTDSHLRPERDRLQGFFRTAIHDRHIPMMAIASLFGAGFSAMYTFFPLLAKELGIRAGIFFTSYGLCLVGVRICLGHLADRSNRERLIFFCLLGFAIMMFATSQIMSLLQSAMVGLLFGVSQGLSYPAMMARMVDRSTDYNRAVVVALFTGSFGAGIHISAFIWGSIAGSMGLSFMFLSGGLALFASALISALVFHRTRPRRNPVAF